VDGQFEKYRFLGRRYFKLPSLRVPANTAFYADYMAAGHTFLLESGLFVCYSVNKIPDTKRKMALIPIYQKTLAGPGELTIEINYSEVLPAYSYLFAVELPVWVSRHLEW
jgi:hypothetical protein